MSRQTTAITRRENSVRDERKRPTNVKHEITSYFSAMSSRSSIATRSTRNTVNPTESGSRSLRLRTLSGRVADRSLSTSSASRQQHSSVHVGSSVSAEQTLSQSNSPQQQPTQQPIAIPSSSLTVSINDDDMEVTDEDEDGQTPAHRKSRTNLLPIHHLFREDAPGVFTCLVQVHGKLCEKVLYLFSLVGENE